MGSKQFRHRASNYTIWYFFLCSCIYTSRNSLELYERTNMLNNIIFLNIIMSWSEQLVGLSRDLALCEYWPETWGLTFGSWRETDKIRKMVMKYMKTAPENHRGHELTSNGLLSLCYKSKTDFTHHPFKTHPGLNHCWHLLHWIT